MVNSLRLMQERIRVKVAVINRKGGTGKTTAAVNLAGELALRGYNVGIVDTDSQGHAALYLGIEQEDNLFKALIGVQSGGHYEPVPLEQLVRQVPLDSYLAPFADPAGVVLDQQDYQRGQFWLLPGFENTFRIPTLLDDIDLFGDMLDAFMDICDLDILIIDNAPTISLFDGSVYKAADAFLYVTECEMGSMQGLARAFQQVQRASARRVKQGLPPNRVIGIQPNKFSSLREHALNIGKMENAFPGLVWEVIRKLKAYPSSNNRGQTVRAFRPTGPEAAEISKMVTRVERQVVEWLTTVS